MIFTFIRTVDQNIKTKLKLICKQLAKQLQNTGAPGDADQYVPPERKPVHHGVRQADGELPHPEDRRPHVESPGEEGAEEHRPKSDVERARGRPEFEALAPPVDESHHRPKEGDTVDDDKWHDGKARVKFVHGLVQ